MTEYPSSLYEPDVGRGLCEPVRARVAIDDLLGTHVAPGQVRAEGKADGLEGPLVARGPAQRPRAPEVEGGRSSVTPAPSTVLEYECASGLYRADA